MSRPRVMGIDPGLRWTGWGVAQWVSGGMAIGAWGVIETAQEDRPQALAALATALRAVLTAQAPDEVAIERAFVKANTAMALRLGEARGVCLAEAAGRGHGVAELAPTHVKRALTGSGRAGKDQVARMVARLGGVDLAKAPSHATDALACAMARAFASRPLGIAS